MTMNVTPPYPFITDQEGDPLEDGAIYIGAANLNPILSTNQVALYSDQALMIPLAQPVRTQGGLPININGSPTQVFVAGASYSIIVLDKNGLLVWSNLNVSQAAVPWTSITYDTTSGELTAGAVIVNKYYQPGYWDRYGTNTVPGTTDMSGAASMAYKVAAQSGCSVRYGATAPYRLAAPVNCTAMRGIVTWDESSKNASASQPSVIIDHDGFSYSHGFDLSCSTEMVFNNMVPTNGAGRVPNCVFFMARNGVGSGAGQHRFNNIHTSSTATFKHVFYNYASEENVIENSILYNNRAGSTIFNFNATNTSAYTSSFQAIAAGIQSNVGHYLVNVNLFNAGNSGANNEVCIALESAGNFNWINGLGYCPHGLAYVSVGGVNGLNFLTMENIRGETDGTSTTVCGIAVRCSAATGVNSLTNWKLCQFAFNTGGAGYLIDFNATSDIVGLTMRDCYSSSGNLALVHGLSRSIIEHGSQSVVGLAGGLVDGNTFVGVRSNVTLLTTATNNTGFDQATGRTWETGDSYTAPAAACTGAITAAGIVWSLTKFNRKVTLMLPAISAVATATPFFDFGSVLPAAYRPASDRRIPVVILDNGVTPNNNGYAFIFAATGVIRIYKDNSSATNFTAAAGAGLPAVTEVSWTI